MCDAKNSNMSNLFLEITCTRYKLGYTRVHTNKIRSTTYDNAIFEKKGSYLNYHYNPERNSFHKKIVTCQGYVGDDFVLLGDVEVLPVGCDGGLLVDVANKALCTTITDHV